MVHGDVSSQNSRRVGHQLMFRITSNAGVFDDSEEAMKNFASKVKRFLKSEDGPTAVEYAVMLSLIIVICLSAVRSVGTNASSTFTSVAGQISGTPAS